VPRCPCVCCCPAAALTLGLRMRGDGLGVCAACAPTARLARAARPLAPVPCRSSFLAHPWMVNPPPLFAPPHTHARACLVCRDLAMKEVYSATGVSGANVLEVRGQRRPYTRLQRVRVGRGWGRGRGGLASCACKARMWLCPRPLGSLLAARRSWGWWAARTGSRPCRRPPPLFWPGGCSPAKCPGGARLRRCGAPPLQPLTAC
jgi:hypothetical protein